MTDRCGDPIFQLNAILWMLQPLPQNVSDHIPKAVLHEYGYRVRALGRRLTSDATIERQLATELDLRGVPVPDVIASPPASHPWPVFECKRSSFGPNGNEAKQASKIMARAADMSLIAGSSPGVPANGTVVYVTRKNQAAQLQTTLDQLRYKLVGASVQPASASTVSLDSTPGSGLVAKLEGGEFPGPVSSTLAQGVVVLPAVGPEEYPRHLYFIPYDPSVTQDPEEKRHCLRVLLARGRASAASIFGQSQDIGTIVIEGNALLHGATYGISEYWSEPNDRKQAAKTILKFVREALSSMRPCAPNVTEESSPPRIKVLIASEEQLQACAEIIMAHPLPAHPQMTPELPFPDASTT